MSFRQLLWGDGRRKPIPRGRLGELYRRSGAKCEGYKLKGLSCRRRLTSDMKPHVHHIDGNPRNNRMSNLLLLCTLCHDKVTKLKRIKRYDLLGPYYKTIKKRVPLKKAKKRKKRKKRRAREEPLFRW